MWIELGPCKGSSHTPSKYSLGSRGELAAEGLQEEEEEIAEKKGSFCSCYKGIESNPSLCGMRHWPVIGVKQNCHTQKMQ